MKRLTSLVMFASLAILLAACGGQDPYADPGTPPPPPIEDPTITTSGSISEKPGSSDLMEINVAGFLAPESEVTTATGDLSTLQRPRLGRGDFTVVEAGTVKGITVEEIGAGDDAPADVVFVLDTTGSMGPGLQSVRDSVVSFAEHLTSSGLDVRLGAVTFGDAFDTIDAGSTSPGSSLKNSGPPGFDPDERPTLPFTESSDEFEQFMNHATANVVDGSGGDAPENAIGSVEFAYDEFDWRGGAQRHLVVVTDICSHNATTYADAGIEGRWIPGSASDVAELNAVIHVVSPANVHGSGYCSDDTTDMADVASGVYVEWDGTSEFDLTETDLSAAAGGWIVTFRGTKDGEPKDVRVVIDAGSDIRGEFTLEDVVY